MCTGTHHHHYVTHLPMPHYIIPTYHCITILWLITHLLMPHYIIPTYHYYTMTHHCHYITHLPMQNPNLIMVHYLEVDPDLAVASRELQVGRGALGNHLVFDSTVCQLLEILIRSWRLATDQNSRQSFYPNIALETILGGLKFQTFLRHAEIQGVSSP